MLRVSKEVAVHDTVQCKVYNYTTYAFAIYWGPGSSDASANRLVTARSTPQSWQVAYNLNHMSIAATLTVPPMQFLSLYWMPTVA